jgi:hypothetical protein
MKIAKKHLAQEVFRHFKDWVDHMIVNRDFLMIKYKKLEFIHDLDKVIGWIENYVAEKASNAHKRKRTNYEKVCNSFSHKTVDEIMRN